jgi:ribulose-5-phosphate 4-epimerase/fuculose-1-phosphate aldolase
VSEGEAGRAIVDAGRRLSARGLAPGSSGNVSVRTRDGFLMTPTGSPLDALVEERLARLDASGDGIAGETPTKERDLHLAVYRVRPGAAAVVHLHSSHAVALACRADLDPDEPLAPLTPYQVMRVHPLGLAPYRRPGSPELAAAVEEVARGHAAMLLRNHGTLVAAASLEAAVFGAEELEEAARIRLLVGDRAVRRLTAEEVDDIRRNLQR